MIRRCLEKNPTERFQSARDVTFALDAVSNATSSAHPIPADAAPPARRATALGVVVASALGLALAVAAYVAGTRAAPPPAEQPTFKQLTYRSGSVRGARFAPDGQSVVYGAAWEGRPIELYSVRELSPESSAVSLPAADLLDVSSTGEMAVSLKAAGLGPFFTAGTLARASLAGGAARELLEGVVAADWSPDGKQLAVVRRVGNTNSMQLEFPQGTVLYEAPFWISNPRVSPDGTSIALITHPRGGDEGQRRDHRSGLARAAHAVGGLDEHPGPRLDARWPRAVVYGDSGRRHPRDPRGHARGSRAPRAPFAAAADAARYQRCRPRLGFGRNHAYRNDFRFAQRKDRAQALVVRLGDEPFAVGGRAPHGLHRERRRCRQELRRLRPAH